MVIRHKCNLLIIYLIISKSSLSRPRLNLFLFCYLFYLIGIILGGLVSDSIIQSFLYATLLLVKFLLLEQVFVTKNYYLVSTALSLSVISPILISAFSSNRIIGVFQVIFSSFQSNDFSTRLFLAGFNPNFIGITSSISFILLFDCFIRAKRLPRLVRIVLAVVSFLCLSFLVQSSSRSAIAGVIVYFLLYTLSIISAKNWFTKFVVVGLIGFGVFQSFGILESIFQVNSVYRGIGTGFTGRIDIWQQILPDIELIGHGYSQFIVDNSWLLATYYSGILFALPLFLCIAVLIIKLVFSNNIYSVNFYAGLKSLSAIFLLNSFFNQQAFTLTSPMSYVILFIILSFQSSDPRMLPLK